jgi:GTP:adenosylcobinamide-phosphate guanylyltransferase
MLLAMALQVIITAGGELPRDMRGEGYPANKALLQLGGRTLLERALAAAQGLPGVGDVGVVGDAAVHHALPSGIAQIPAGGSVIDNMVRGFEHHGGARHDYLVLSSDLAFITPAALAGFADAASAAGELAVPVVTRDDFLARFPGAPNKFERIGGRELTMGSVFFFTGPLLQTNIPLMHDFARHRKSPAKLAMLLGWEVLWGFVTRSITLETLERRAAAITGGRVRAVPSAAAELAFDIDTRAEFEFAQQRFATAAGAP